MLVLKKFVHLVQFAVLQTATPGTSEVFEWDGRNPPNEWNGE